MEVLGGSDAIKCRLDPSRAIARRKAKCAERRDTHGSIRVIPVSGNRANKELPVPIGWLRSGRQKVAVCDAPGGIEFNVCFLVVEWIRSRLGHKNKRLRTIRKIHGAFEG